MCVCACACVYLCMCVRAHVCVCVLMCVCVCIHECVCMYFISIVHDRQHIGRSSHFVHCVYFPQEQELIDMSEDAYYVDKEIIEQQLQTKTYEMSREEAKQYVL